MSDVVRAETKRLTPDLGIRERIFGLQNAMVEHLGAENVKKVADDLFPLKHFFAPGGTCKYVYAREILLPAGTVVVGKIHKHAHLNMLMRGRVRVLTEKGPEEFVGPLTMVSQPGTKRAVYAIEDSVWVTVHLTNSEDLAEIEDEIIAPTFDDLEKFLLEEKP